MRFDIKNLQKWLMMAEGSAYRASALAKNLGVCQRQLQRYTQRVFGCTPQQWLDEQRLVAAAERLKGSRSVKSVAFSLGFKQVSHFSREFKRYYGQSASAFLIRKDLQRALDSSRPS